jgi:glucose/arabinose dehydrogenase
MIKTTGLQTYFEKHLLMSMRALVLAFLCTSAMASAQTSANSGLSLHPVITDLPASWAISVSPDNLLYVSHRRGDLAIYTLAGELLTRFDLQLDDLYYEGQGGLSALAFHPDFTQTPWLYLSYSYGQKNVNGLKVIRVLLENNEKAVRKVLRKDTIFEQADLRNTAVHYGARLAFMQDKTLLISTGDGFDFRENAQKKPSDMGKILRLSDTGSIPTGNPFENAATFSEKAIYSFGHRNPQGLVVMPNNVVIAHEHGPAGGDEINIIKPGNNYGWPVITRGKDYIGSLISPFTEYEGMQQPTVNWTPSIAPSAMVFYSGTQIPSFTGRLLVSSLKFKQIHALRVNSESINDERIFFANSEYRMRDITVSPSGQVFVLSDGDNASIFEVVMTH